MVCVKKGKKRKKKEKKGKKRKKKGKKKRPGPLFLAMPESVA
jgi:hypothetical protein